jgi:uncharacterized protein (DUF1697 family)
MKYVAFLRGINVGGNVTIKMTELKEAFDKAGFKNVQTILASGNVMFDSENRDPDAITRKIELVLKKKWKREITVFVRTVEELRRMADGQPFKGVTVTPNTRRYVTFLYEFSRGLKIPELPTNVKITRMKDDAVFTVVELAPELDTPDSMASLNKALGAKITARNWNTIEKILTEAMKEPTPAPQDAENSKSTKPRPPKQTR